jgi:hypothetical protein
MPMRMQIHTRHTKNVDVHHQRPYAKRYLVLLMHSYVDKARTPLPDSMTVHEPTPSSSTLIKRMPATHVPQQYVVLAH